MRERHRGGPLSIGEAAVVALLTALLASVFTALFAQQGDSVLLYLLGAVVTGATAIVAAYAAEWFRSHVFTGAFEITTSTGPPHFQAETNLALETERRSNTLYYRIAVTNVGRTEARECQVVLETVDYRAGQDWYRLGYWQPCNLNWSVPERGKVPEAISRHRTLYCDLGFVPDQDALVNDRANSPVGPRWPGSPPGPQFALGLTAHHTTQPSRLPLGEFVLGIAVYSSNTDPARAWVLLDFQPTFEAIGSSAFSGQPAEGISLSLIDAQLESLEVVNTPLEVRHDEDRSAPYAVRHPQRSESQAEGASDRRD